MCVAAAIVGSAAVGAVASSRAASKAAGAQRDAANMASATQREALDRQTELQTPFRDAGLGALNQLVTGTAAGGDLNRDFTTADFNADPGLAFRIQQGQRALESSAAARGGLLSGGTGRALVNYGQEAGSQEFGAAYNRFNADRERRFSRLSNLAGLGQNASNVIGSATQNTANNVSNNQAAIGNAESAKYIAQGNAINQLTGTIGNLVSGGGFGGQQPSGQQWWAAGQPGGNLARGSFGTRGLNQFFYQNGTSGD
jgi:hypothetical protein